jgi:hypothetical protein
VTGETGEEEWDEESRGTEGRGRSVGKGHITLEPSHVIVTTITHRQVGRKEAPLRPPEGP